MDSLEHAVSDQDDSRPPPPHIGDHRVGPTSDSGERGGTREGRGRTDAGLLHLRYVRVDLLLAHSNSHGPLLFGAVSDLPLDIHFVLCKPELPISSCLDPSNAPSSTRAIVVSLTDAVNHPIKLTKPSLGVVS